MIPEDKQSLKEIQSALKSLYIKYDHVQTIALRYDNINLNSN